MKAFYPASTPDIIHKGLSGNIYRLDCIETGVVLCSVLNKNKNFDVVKVQIKEKWDEVSAVELVGTAHSVNLLESYKTGNPVFLANSSGLMWQPRLYDHVLELALSSKLVVDEAMATGGAVAIASGGHHAEVEITFGFDAVNTMAIAAKYASRLGQKVAVIDLDTHFSNGCIDILQNQPNITLYSLWNQTLDKWKYFESMGNIWHRNVVNVQEYFKNLSELLGSIKILNPDIIIYHLGCDVLETDRMGGIPGMTDEKLLERDERVRIVIQEQLHRKFVIFLGGAYVDRTKGVKNAEKLRSNSIALFEKILNDYAENL